MIYEAILKGLEASEDSPEYKSFHDSILSQLGVRNFGAAFLHIEKYKNEDDVFVKVMSNNGDRDFEIGKYLKEFLILHNIEFKSSSFRAYHINAESFVKIIIEGEKNAI